VAKRRTKPSKNRYFCYAVANGKLKWVANTTTGFSFHKARAKLLRPSEAADLASNRGVRCKIAKYNAHKGQLGYVYTGRTHQWKAKRRGR